MSTELLASIFDKNELLLQFYAEHYLCDLLPLLKFVDLKMISDEMPKNVIEKVQKYRKITANKEIKITEKEVSVFFDEGFWNCTQVPRPLQLSEPTRATESPKQQRKGFRSSDEHNDDDNEFEKQNKKAMKLWFAEKHKVNERRLKEMDSDSKKCAFIDDCL